MIDLERFPTSPAAKRMMKTVSPVYDKSYVGKWIFQVMGMEVDEAWKFFEELRLQAFPETATWGIIYWEQRYHIPPDDNLTIEERRQRVIVKRGKRSPMNPVRIEQLTRDITQRQAVVTERNEEYVFFIAILPGEAQVDYHELIKTVRSVKPSHLSPVVLFETKVGLIIQADSQKTYPFGYTLAGTVPDTNTIGALRRESLVLAADMEGHLLNYPVAGISKAGEEPDINMVGMLGRSTFILETGIESHKHEYPAAGTGAAGETPDTNTIGALRSEDFTIKASMEGTKLIYPVAGTKPDTNTAGKAESGSVLPSISAEGSVFDYQLCGEAEDEV